MSATTFSPRSPNEPARGRTYRRTPFVDGVPVAERLVVLDRARGIALIGVAAVNLSVFVSDAGAGASTNSLDRVLYWLNYTFLNGKCFPILAALFGYSLGLQLQRPGNLHGHRRVAKRRLFALGVLGLIHGLLLYRFDILLAYALLGTCTYWLRHVRWRSLLVLCATLILSGAWLLANSGIDPQGLVRIGPSLAIDRYRHGSLIQLVDLHLRNFSANLSREVLAQWPFVLAMLLLGVFAERFDFARRSTTRQRSILLGLGVGAAALTVGLGNIDSNSWTVYLATALQPLISLGVIGAVMFWTIRSPHAIAIDAFGRMSLSCYLAQSVIFSVTLYGFGLGLFRWFSPTVQTLYLAALVVAEIILARGFLRRYAKGPMEELVDRWARRIPNSRNPRLDR